MLLVPDHAINTYMHQLFPVKCPPNFLTGSVLTIIFDKAIQGIHTQKFLSGDKTRGQSTFAPFESYCSSVYTQGSKISNQFHVTSRSLPGHWHAVCNVTLKIGIKLEKNNGPACDVLELHEIAV